MALQVPMTVIPSLTVYVVAPLEEFHERLMIPVPQVPGVGFSPPGMLGMLGGNTHEFEF